MPSVAGEPSPTVAQMPADLDYDGLGPSDPVDGTTIGRDHAVSGTPVRVGPTRDLRDGLQVWPDGMWTDGTGQDPEGPTGPDIGADVPT